VTASQCFERDRLLEFRDWQDACRRTLPRFPGDRSALLSLVCPAKADAGVGLSVTRRSCGATFDASFILTSTSFIDLQSSKSCPWPASAHAGREAVVMFTTETSSHTHSLRSKRTRQAAGTEDTIKLPQAKRKRSALRRDTFEPLADASINEIAGREKSNPKTNGHIEPRPKPPTSQTKELSYRGPKHDRRADRERATTVLTTNEFYTVSELPSLPQQVRDLDKHNKAYTCTFSIEHGYALVVSHTEAIIWPYHSSASIPSARDVVTIPLSFIQTSESDPLPLATFTARAANGEPGLLVVSARWGSVVYWDTITSASTITPGRSTNGVQGSVPSLGGESVKDLINAEPSGFILAFSHGRVAHVSYSSYGNLPVPVC
jgi:nuclear pore complex protein Nup133